MSVFANNILVEPSGTILLAEFARVRRLNVATSADGAAWQTEFSGSMGGAAVLAAYLRPADVRLDIPLRGSAIRFIRLQLEEGTQSKAPWVVSDVTVTTR